jgi:hypothetical protein
MPRRGAGGAYRSLQANSLVPKEAQTYAFENPSSPRMQPACRSFYGGKSVRSGLEIVFSVFRMQFSRVMTITGKKWRDGLVR